jgi:hypothetical protein
VGQTKYVTRIISRLPPGCNATNIHSLVSSLHRNGIKLLLNLGIEIRQAIDIHRQSTLSEQKTTSRGGISVSTHQRATNPRAHLVSPPSPSRIILLGLLHFVHWKCPKHFIYIMFLSPIFAIRELLERFLRVESACTEKPTM